MSLVLVPSLHLRGGSPGEPNWEVKVLGWRQKVNGREDPCLLVLLLPASEWHLLALPLLLVLMVLLSLLSLPKSPQTWASSSGELGQMCLGLGVGIQCMWPLGQQLFLWAPCPRLMSVPRHPLPLWLWAMVTTLLSVMSPGLWSHLSLESFTSSQAWGLGNE